MQPEPPSTEVVAVIPMRAPAIDADGGRVRETVRSSRAVVAAAAPKIAARIPLRVSWQPQPTVTGGSTTAGADGAVVAGSMPYAEPAATGDLVPANHASLPQQAYPQTVPARPWTLPKVARPPWNPLAVLALPLAVLFPLIGFIAGIVAARQVRKRGERGGALATLAWIFGLGLTIFETFALIVVALAIAVKSGVEGGIQDLFVTFLNWLFNH
jgi:hypothetical protein